ncbi:MAG: helix-turn-helix transcriptional regulator [Acidaminococcaceae bacterium]|nr:helix-turn-helix transcriptional regulator [Acidaminococcaceae bacterium]
MSAGEERPEHRNQDYGYDEAYDYQTGTYFYCLFINGPTRYNELKRKLEAATFRTLSATLKELEADDLIVRKEFNQIPPKVEYSLSPLGESMTSFLEAFCGWGQKHRPK